MYFLLGDMTEAQKSAEQCIAIDPENVPDVYYVRGLILKALSRKDEAIDDFNKCLKIQYKIRVFSKEEVMAAMK